MRNIDRAQYGATVRRLIEDAMSAGLPRTLPFAPPPAKVRAALSTIAAAHLADRPVLDARAASACRAGLWLLYDFMDEGHGIAQDLDTAEGSYWHGIVHRREPDPSNARYWFSHLGRHPIFPELLADARELAQGESALRPLVGATEWRPERFIGLCEERPEDPRLLAIQRREWELLYAHTFTLAFGV